MFNSIADGGKGKGGHEGRLREGCKMLWLVLGSAERRPIKHEYLKKCLEQNVDESSPHCLVPYT